MRCGIKRSPVYGRPSMRDLVRSPTFRLALHLLSLGFVGFAVWTLKGRWDSEASVAVAVMPTAFAVASMAGAMWLLALAWAVLMRRMTGVSVPLQEFVATYAGAALGKYLPAKVGQPMLRIAGVAVHGVTARSVMASMGIEILAWFSAGALVSGVLLLVGSGAQGVLSSMSTLGRYVVALASVGTIVLATVDRSRIPPRIRELLALEGQGALLPPAVVILHLGSWALWALHGVFVLAAVSSLPLDVAVSASALFVAAPIAGFLALPLPAGIGVRESLLVLGLTPIIGAPAGLAAALVSRAVSLVGDLVLWLLFARKRGAPAGEPLA